MTDSETAAHFQARSARYRSEAEQAATPDLANVYRLVADALENVAAVLRADRNGSVRDDVVRTLGES